MSREIDQKVVEMRFDNRDFESNVKTSLRTIDKLKNSLDMDGAVKELDKVDNAVAKVNMGGISSAIDAVKVKFSALQVVAVNVLSRITNAVISTGKQMLNSLTVAPISQGFSEYELKMGSVQTIMASTGESLETVNGYLNELNAYADKTIYSFADMTANIGKFTNAGVKLEDAVKAIQGISNEAAVSGANANEASRAMYNFAQALSSGSVRLIDWKSIENANMATVEFKQQLIDTAVEMGTLVKVRDKYRSTTTDMNGKVSQLFTSTTMFNDSLSSQWMTSEVLVKTLGKYSDETSEIGKKAFAAAQDVKTFTQLMDTLKEAVGSGWAQTWEILFGDFNEAKSLWTSVSKVVGGFIDRTSDARNGLLGSWKDLGGRAKLIEVLKNAFEGLVSVVKPIGQAFREIFPKTSGDALYSVTKKFADFTSKLKVGNKTADNLKNTFKGLFAVIDILKKILGAVTKVLSPLLKLLAKLGSGIIAVTGTIGKWLSALDSAIKKSGIFTKAIKNVTEFVKSIPKALNSAFKAVTGHTVAEVFEKIGNTAETCLNKLREVFSGFGRVDTGGAEKLSKKTEKAFHPITMLFNGVKALFSGIAAFVKSIFPAFSKLLGSVMGIIGGLGTAIGNFFKNADLNDILNLANGGIIASIGVSIKKFVTNISGSIKGVIDSAKDVVSDSSGFAKSINNILDQVRGCLVAYQKELRSRTLLKIAAAVGILALSLIALASVDAAGLTAGVVALRMLLSGLSKTMSMLSGLKTISARNSNAIIALSLVLLAMASAMRKISELGFSKTIAGLVGLAGMSVVLNLTMDRLYQTSKKYEKSKKSFKGLITFAVILRLLASSLKSVAKLGWKQLAVGMMGLAGLSVLLILAMDGLYQVSRKYEKSKKSFKGLITFAVTLRLLVSSLKSIAKLNWKQLAVGMTGVAGLAVIMGVAVEAMQAASKKIGGKKGNVKGVKGLIRFALAINLLGVSLKSIAKLNWKQLAVGLTGVAGVAAIMGVTIVAMQAAAKKIDGQSVKSLSRFDGGDIKGFLKTGDGSGGGVKYLIKFALAINLLGVSLKSVAQLNWKQLAVGLTGVAGVAVIMGATIEAMQAASKRINGDSAKALARFDGGDIKGFIRGSEGSGGGIKCLIKFALAIGLLGASLKSVAQLNWKQLAVGLTGVSGVAAVMGGTIAAMQAAAKKYNAKSVKSLISFAFAIGILTAQLKSIAKLNIGAMVKGLSGLTALAVVMGGTLVTLAGFSKKLGNGKTGASFAKAAGSMLLLASAMTVLTPALKALGSLSVGSMAKSLLYLASAFAIMGVAAKVLGPMTGTIIGLAGAFALIGVASAVFGVGLALISTGLTAFVSSFDVSFGLIVDVIKKVINALPDIIGALAESLGNALPAIIKMLTDTLAALFVVLKDTIPDAVDAVLAFVMKVLAAVAQNIGGIITSLLGIIVGVIEGLANGLPDIISAAVKLIKNIVDALFDAIGGFDFKTVMKALGSLVVLLTAMTLAVAIVVEAIVVTALLPAIGKNLTKFIKSMQPFLNAIGKVNAASLAGAKNLALAVLALTASSFLDAMTPFFAKRKSLSAFGKELSEFAPHIRKYADAVKGIDGKSVTASANAAKTLAQMAMMLPRNGGVIGLIAGDNDMGEFAKQLPVFGGAVKAFAGSVAGLEPSSVEGAANAGKAVAEMAKSLPNTGGLAGWFAGNNDMDDFGAKLVPFGESLAAFSRTVAVVNSSSVKGAASAGEALGEMAKSLPNSGGVVSWFAGEQNLKSFGERLVSFGKSIVEFSGTVSGKVSAKAVQSASNAGKTLAEMAKSLPGTGGVVGWFFGGTKNAKKFGKQMVSYGKSIAKFSKTVSGVNAGSVKNAASAGLTMAEFADKLPSNGGMLAKITGQKDIKKFGKQMVSYGKSIKKFAKSISGLDAGAADNAASAGAALAGLAKNLPNTGGLKGWFTGNKDLGSFGKSLVPFGAGIELYSLEVKGINADAVKSSAYAGQTLIKLLNSLPKSGGILGLFTGSRNLGAFGMSLVPLGTGIKLYSLEVKGIDAADVVASAKAGEALVKVAQTLPKLGGLVSIFTGEQDVATFGAQLPLFGVGLKSYSDSVSGIGAHKKDLSVSTVAAKALGEVAGSIPNLGGFISIFTGEQDLGWFGVQLAGFGAGMRLYAKAVKGIGRYKADLTASAEAGQILADLADSLPKNGGIFNAFTGSKQEIDEFGAKLESFGKGMAAYSRVLGKNFDAYAVDSSAKAGKMLAEMDATLPAKKAGFSFAGLFLESATDIAKFGKKAEAFGASMGKYSLSLTANGKNVFNSEAVTASANAGKMLAGMAKNLPADSGGFNFKKLIVGTKEEIDEFGVKLRSFGVSLANYSVAVGKIDMDKLDRSTVEFGKLHDALKETENVNYGAVSGFSNGLTIVAQSGIDGFIKAFTGAASKISSKVGETLNHASVAAKQKRPLFVNVGEQLAKGLADGLNSKKSVTKAQLAAAALAKAAAEAAAKELDEHSPSKVGYRIGDYFGVAFVGALEDYGDRAYGAGEEMASSAKKGLRDTIARIGEMIDSDIDTQPTIRPVLDLSDIERGAGKIDSAFSRTKALSLNAEMSDAVHPKIQNEGGAGSGTSFNFTQNNYSPKALSRIDIYRQTKNQFAAMKEAMSRS